MFADFYNLTLYKRGYTDLTRQKIGTVKILKSGTQKISNVIHRNDMFVDIYL